MRVVSRKVRWQGVALATLVLAASACDRRPQPNVLIVTFDTTRADHIAAYGHPRAQTPNVDRLAEEGVLFSRAQSAIPLTLPSHASILTGVYPTAHGIRDNGLFVLGDDVVTLAEMLQAAGYATGAAVSGFPLVERFNLHQGFDFYDDDLRRRDEDFLGRRGARGGLFFEERRAAQANAALLP